jgi:hypothetical protein
MGQLLLAYYVGETPHRGIWRNVKPWREKNEAELRSRAAQLPR